MDTFKILCPTDFSECSLNAIEYAAKLGEQYNAELILFHVPNTEDYQKLLSRNPKVYDLLNFAEKKLESLVEEVKKESVGKGLKEVRSLIKEGKISATILDYANEQQVDLIIMGTEGINDFKTNYIGTRTSRVVAAAKMDVFVVPRKVFFKKPRKFVFATDYMEEDKLAIQKVIEMANYFESEIDIVHVGTKKKSIDKALHQTMVAELQPYVSYEKVNYVLKSYRDEPGLGLENYLITAKGDILVTLSKKKSWFDQLFTNNLSKKMSYFINKPLWVIKSL